MAHEPITPIAKDASFVRVITREGEQEVDITEYPSASPDPQPPQPQPPEPASTYAPTTGIKTRRAVTP